MWCWGGLEKEDIWQRFREMVEVERSHKPLSAFILKLEECDYISHKVGEKSS